MNLELLLRARQAILDHPGQLNMGVWIVGNSDTLLDCGTVGCIAGWAISCAGERVDADLAGPQARRLLEITGPQSASLFHLNEWPQEEQLAYYAAARCGDAARAAVVARRIDRWLVEQGYVTEQPETATEQPEPVTR